MAEPSQENAEVVISDALAEALRQLTTDQIRYVVARQECSTDREAARMIGVNEATVYRWPSVVKEAARLMVQDGVVTALELRRRALAKAMLTKVALLDNKSPTVRDKAATDIIEWELGKATQKQEMTGQGGAPLIVNIRRTQSSDGDAGL